MQFGVFTVGDVTTNPITGRTATEHERIESMVAIALKAEEIGLDVFATGEHHNPPFVPSSPTTMLGYIAARTSRIILSTATTLITTNDPVKIAEDYAMLQHLADGRVDLMMGRGNTGPVYPWFGQDIRNGVALAIENYALLRRLWREDVVDWQGRFRTPLTGFTAVPRPLDGVPPFVWHGSIRSTEIAEQAAYYGDGFFHNNIFWPKDHVQKMVGLYRRRFERYGHGRADQAIVGLGGQIFVRPNSQDAVREFRPYFDHAPVYGRGPSLEDYMASTALTVGSPQQVIDRTLEFRGWIGDYQRQLFLVDHAGLPLQDVLEQMDILGRDVLPVLRREMDRHRPADVPDAPTHPRLKAAKEAAERTRPTQRRPKRTRPTQRRPMRRLPLTCRLRSAHRAESRARPRRSRRAAGARPGSPDGMSDRSLVVISSGLSQPSATRLLADRLAAGTDRELRAAGVVPAVQVVELREFAQDLANNLLTGFPSTGLRAALDAVMASDGLIAVTPIFSASFSGLFKLFFDVLETDSLAGKPVLIAATAGTPRHSLALDHALRPLFAYFGAAVVPTAVFAAAEDWGTVGSAMDGDLVDRMDRAARELAAAMARRERTVVIDPFAEPTSFEDLLRSAAGGDATI